MGKTENNQNGLSDPELHCEESRASPRFTLLIRSAKLVCGNGEYLCIVRDVSETGVRLRLFHPSPPEGPLTLELAAGDSFAVEKIWERGDHAGFRFANPIELKQFIAETGPYPKRPVRLRLEFPAIVTTDNGPSVAMVRNISRQGACIETSRLLALGQTVKLEADGLPELLATVCWRSSPAYGLVLQQVFTFEELAMLANRLKVVGGDQTFLEGKRYTGYG
ncbi:MAG: PilZ domain-containing protein [Novosphingobium sp.]|nr:PilZ domain-containing protein [Novosphingobium sp.]